MHNMVTQRANGSHYKLAQGCGDTEMMKSSLGWDAADELDMVRNYHMEGLEGWDN